MPFTRYGRLVGRVYVNGVEANLSQLEAGLAWVYRENLDDLPPADRVLFRQVEAAARSQHLGLWHDKRPTPPWVWRHRATHRRLSQQRTLRAKALQRKFERSGCR